MVKEQRTRQASAADAKRFAGKANEYRRAMVLVHKGGLWDAAVSNGVHALILMANALAAKESGEYFVGRDHSMAPTYLLRTLGPDAKTATQQMRLVLSLKSAAEYDRRSCTGKESSDVVKRAERFFTWAEAR